MEPLDILKKIKSIIIKENAMECPVKGKDLIQLIDIIMILWGTDDDNQSD